MDNSTMQVSQQNAQATTSDFDLDISLLEIADPAGLVNITNDNCGSTCGACTTGVA